MTDAEKIQAIKKVLDGLCDYDMNLARDFERQQHDPNVAPLVNMSRSVSDLAKLYDESIKKIAQIVS